MCSKLIYSFLLGVVLLMQRTLMSLTVLGWWTQWLLVSAMWWGAFLQAPPGARLRPRRVPLRARTDSLLRHAGRVSEALQNPPAMVRGAKWVKDKLRTPPPSVEQRRKLEQAGRARAKGMADGQVKRYARARARRRAAR